MSLPNIYWANVKDSLPGYLKRFLGLIMLFDTECVFVTHFITYGVLEKPFGNPWIQQEMHIFTKKFRDMDIEVVSFLYVVIQMGRPKCSWESYCHFLMCLSLCSHDPNTIPFPV